ncbi:MAG: ATP-binding protein [Candidatus Micrarchaeota archaeon]
MDFSSTAEIGLPRDPLEWVIGQENAVRIARVCASQRRHLLLVGAPGTGKSMVARAIAGLLPRPGFEVSVLHNPSRPEKPVLSVRSGNMIKSEKPKEFGVVLLPGEVPGFVSEQLGMRCRRCGGLSHSRIPSCPHCGADKVRKPVVGFRFPEHSQKNVVEAVRTRMDGSEEMLIYERTNDDCVRMLTEKELKARKEYEAKMMRKVIVPLSRPTFVQVVGNNETELLGDVRHDPYGGHPEIGTQPYMRVVAGAVHEAHEGVLFVDEMATLGETQRFLLTAMQEKKFAITGRNPNSAGAAVRVEDVPCDFILVGALNINDLGNLSPALRSRIRGSGYEVLLNTSMEDTPENQTKVTQFVAQEIKGDGKIPHASSAAVEELLEESRRICKEADGKKGLTLRFRNLSGLIRLAGDLAKSEKSELIQKEHVRSAVIFAKSAEEQLSDKYENPWSAGMADFGVRSRKGSETV